MSEIWEEEWNINSVTVETTVTDTRLSVKGESEDDDVDRVEEVLEEQS